MKLNHEQITHYITHCYCAHEQITHYITHWYCAIFTAVMVQSLHIKLLVTELLSGLREYLDR